MSDPGVSTIPDPVPCLSGAHTSRIMPALSVLFPLCQHKGFCQADAGRMVLRDTVAQENLTISNLSGQSGSI